ncbi:MAG: hypothetical protein ACKV2T_12060 [Kofleriaceae bacterium]
MSRPLFTIELAADARFAEDLAAGGVFVPARGFNVLDEIDLVVRGLRGELCLHARVVYVDPSAGCGLELVGFGPGVKEQLAQIASTPAEVAAVAATKQRRKRLLTNRSRRNSIEVLALDDTATIVAGGVPIDDDFVDDLEDGDALDDECEDPGDDAVGEPASSDTDDIPPARTASGRIPLNAQERLRGIPLAEQLKIARGPSASERMALERMYGKNVWEALLHNPGLTTPEVARLARLGTLPRVLLELVVNNNTWLQVPEVRRALLGNPRLGTDQITRVLRLLPKHELKIASTVPAYPASVRSLAKKMIKDSE